MMKKPSECCTDVESDSCRNNYFEGKRLTTDAFRVEQRYFLQRRYLLNRALFGWGVVYGFGITEEGGRFTIGSGLALDECGRELVQTTDRAITLGDVHLFDEPDDTPKIDPWAQIKDIAAREGQVVHWQHGTSAPPECWRLSVHYAEKPTGSSTVKDSCSCEHDEWQRTCETVYYALHRIECTECCDDDACGLTCECATGPCCKGHPDAPARRGGCRCLCDHLTKLNPNPEDCCDLQEIDTPCGPLRVDLNHGVALACVTVVRDAAGQWSIGEVTDPCGPRRLVKRNDLLFDLIRGCDLTRIDAISWWPSHRGQMSFDQFDAFFGPEGKGKVDYLTTFSVTFTRPVRENTLKADCFAMTVISVETEGRWGQVQRVPIVDVKKFPVQQGDPAGYVRGCFLVVEGGYVEDALRGRGSLFKDEVNVEIEIRGDFIIDCNGQAVDANAVGLSASPSGNGTPGGIYISTFRVLAKPAVKGAE